MLAGDEKLQAKSLPRTGIKRCRLGVRYLRTTHTRMACSAAAAASAANARTAKEQRAERWGKPAPTDLRQARNSVRDVIDQGLVIQSHENYLHAPWYILRPVSRFMSGWDLLTTMALLFTAAITPFEVAFLEKAESTNDGLFIANRLLDVIFVLDMSFQFFLMFRVGRDEGSGTYWEYRLPQIALHYLKGWYALDLLSIFPSLFDILPFVPAVSTESCLVHETV